MAANNLDFFNECLEGIGKRKLTDGKAENTYAPVPIAIPPSSME
jgi:hypothetical protein